MKIFLTFISIELKLFFREKANIIYILLLPIILLLVFGFIFTNPFRKIKINIIDNDNSEYSSLMITYIKNNPNFKIEEIKNNSSISKNNVLLKIPKGFEESLKNNEYIYIDLLIGSHNEQKIKIITGTLKSYLPELNQKLLKYQYKINFKYNYTSNFRYSYIEFLIPGLIFMVIISLCLYNICLKLTIYRQFNQLKIYYTFPINKILFLFVHITINLFIVLIQTIILLLLSVFIFKARFPENIGLFIGSIMLSSITFFSLGFLLSAFFKDYSTAMSLINIIYYPILLFSGIYFSFDLLPSIFKYLKYISPALYSVNLIRNSYLGYLNLKLNIINITVTIFILIISVIFAAKKFKWYIK